MSVQAVPLPTHRPTKNRRPKKVARPQPARRMVDLALEYLKGEGVRHVFGIPGGLLHPLFEAVEQDEDLELIVTKHEEGAAFMADGFARTGGGIAVCAGTSGPGATNLMTGVGCAYADGVPMLVLTGQAHSKALGRGASQETGREDIDIVSMFQPITKYSAQVPSADMLGLHLRRALRAALTGRPGPVHLNASVDLWSQPVEETWRPPSEYRPETHLFDRDAIKRAAETLIRARRPVILAGSGVVTAGAQAHLRELAELLDARVASTPRGKGVFPENHPQALGVLGMGGQDLAKDVVLSDEVDVLFAVGASLGETSTFNWDPRLLPSGAFIQSDIDADRIGRAYPVDVAVVGCARTVLLELLYALKRLVRTGEPLASGWTEAEENEPPVNGKAPTLQVVPDRVTPQSWRSELQSVLPRDAIVFSDVGGHMLFNLKHLRIGANQKFVLNLGFASMGHGTVASMGAALAHPGRPVIAIVGDACFTMNGMEILSAVEYNIPVVWIVENNQMHGITWHGSQAVGRKKPLQAIRYKKPPRIDALAGAMGVPVWRVDGPGQLADAVRAALKSGGPAVVDVHVDPSVSPPLSDRARAIAGFVNK